MNQSTETVNFNTRIQSTLMSMFRRASESWANRQPLGSVNVNKSNLTRWMLSVLVPAAQEELRRMK